MNPIPPFAAISQLKWNNTHHAVTLRTLAHDDAQSLADYFAQMSEQTRCYFGPHRLDTQMAKQLCELQSLSQDPDLRLVVTDPHNTILGYFIVQFALNKHEVKRYAGYGISLRSGQAASYAPSVKEPLIGSGLGSAVFVHIKDYLQTHHIEKLVLMGGVQARNLLAVHYYQKYGFKTVGGYQSEVANLDMILRLISNE